MGVNGAEQEQSHCENSSLVEGGGFKGKNLLDCIRGKGESGRRSNTSRPVLVNIEEQL